MATGRKSAKKAAKEAEKAAKEAEKAAERAAKEAKKARKQKKAKKKIALNSVMLQREAVAYLEAVVDGLKSGEVSFTQGDEALTLALADTLAVEVKAAQKGGKNKVQIELSWRTLDRGEPSDKD